MRLCHIVSDFRQHPLLRARWLERQHLLDALPHAIVKVEAYSFADPRFRALERQPAFEPEELFEDQPELRRRTKRIQQAQVFLLMRKMKFANGGIAVRQFQPLANMRGKRIGKVVQVLKDLMNKHAENASRDFAGRFIDRNNPASVERGLGFRIVRGKNLKLGMHHQQLACVTIQLDLSEQRELQPNREAVGKICAMKPLTHEANRRAVAENNFEKAKVSA